jgi:type I restriction enzyme S subunit
MRNGWIETTLGQVADVIDPHPSHRAPIVDELGIPFIGIGDLRNTGDVDFSKARKVSREILSEHKLRYSRSDYLIGLGRVASIGMVVKLPDDSIDYVVSPTLAVIKAKKILPQFLYISLQGNHLQEQFQKYKKGSTRESVGMQVLRKLSIQVPPLAEQKRIVDLISSVDSYIEALEQQAESARKSRSAVLHEMLSAGGDGWTETTLGEVAAFSSAKVLPEELRPDSKYVGLEHLQPYNLNITDAGLCSEVKSSVTPFNISDVLFGRLRPYLHKVAFADFAGYCSPEILVLTARENCQSKFLAYICDLESTIKFCVDRSAGTKMPRTSQGDLSALKLLLPSISEQKRIVELISSMDDGITATEKLISITKQMRSGLLSDLLDGNHEIPDSYDKVMGAA